MLRTILEGLSLIDATGVTILGTTATTLVLAVLLNLWLRRRYRSMGRELASSSAAETVTSPVFQRLFQEADETFRRSADPNHQAIVEERFQQDLSGLLLAERFVRGATGLVIILGLLGTFYGLTLSIGRIVHLVSSETVASADIAKGIGEGLTHALSGMAVAFSNSLVGVFAAVTLSIVNIFSNVSDQRTAVMVQAETALARAYPRASAAAAPTAGPAEVMSGLNAAVSRFEQALSNFAATTRDFHEFNLHLKDNVARLSLTFSELNSNVRTQLGALKANPPKG